MPHRKDVTPKSLTLLLPCLSGWIHQLDPAARYPALELLLARGRFSPPGATRIDALRMGLFGQHTGHEIPVAALGLLAAGCMAPDDHSYHLRLDPVTLQADMNRVMLLRTGFGGLPEEYRQSVEQALQQVFDEAGMELRASGRDGFWTISLTEEPAVEFTALDDALGADMFECLPAGEAGRPWRRLANEMQMALHALPANEALRAQGVAAINGGWLWGGGRLPAAGEQKAFDSVYSMDPVSSGLARLQQIEVHPLQELSRPSTLLQGRVMVDWAVPASAASAGMMLTPDSLEDFCATAVAGTQQSGGSIDLHTPEFHCRLAARDLRKFWRRPKPLAQQLQALLQAGGKAS